MTQSYPRSRTAESHAATAEKLIGYFELFQFRGNLIDARLRASFVLVSAWRARNADGADRVLAHHDRQGTLRCHEIGEEELRRVGIALDGLGKFPRWSARSTGRIGLLHRVFEGRKTGGRVAYGHNDLAFAAEHMRGHIIALRL